MSTQQSDPISTQKYVVHSFILTLVIPYCLNTVVYYNCYEYFYFPIMFSNMFLTPYLAVPHDEQPRYQWRSQLEYSIPLKK